MTDKSALRKHFSAVRAAVTDKAAKNDAITERLLSLDVIKNAETVLLYASFRSEPDMWGLFAKLRKLGKRTAFPLCGNEGTMTFHIVNGKDELSEGAYGIPEPPSSLPQPEIMGNTVCIVPGLAFTLDGGRLGYGGGFYDRFLAENTCAVRVSAAYEALITDSLPLLQHDLKVGYIVTEERTVLCNEQ